MTTKKLWLIITALALFLCIGELSGVCAQKRGRRKRVVRTATETTKPDDSAAATNPKANEEGKQELEKLLYFITTKIYEYASQPAGDLYEKIYPINYTPGVLTDDSYGDWILTWTSKQNKKVYVTQNNKVVETSVEDKRNITVHLCHLDDKRITTEYGTVWLRTRGRKTIDVVSNSHYITSLPRDEYWIDVRDAKVAADLKKAFQQVTKICSAEDPIK